MQFFEQDGYLAVSMITGPRHNILQVRLSASSDVEMVCEVLPPQGQCVHEPLDEAAIVEAIRYGVAEANRDLGAMLFVSHIRYVQNDTKPESVYSFLVKSILRRVHSEQAYASELR